VVKATKAIVVQVVVNTKVKGVIEIKVPNPN